MGGSILSLTIIPSSIVVGNLQDTGQFLAIGTFSTAPYIRDLTNSPTLTWILPTPNVFPVSTNYRQERPGGGTETVSCHCLRASGQRTATITAEAKDPTTAR